MKHKQLLLITFLFLGIFLSKAQPGYLWDSLEYSGFGDAQQRVKAMTTFNGKLYCGAGQGSISAAIYTSTTARYGSYVVNSNFYSAYSPFDTQILSMTTDGSSNLFAGSENSVTGARVYHCNTSDVWTALPYPGYLTTPDAYPSATSMNIFNIGGQDSLYVGLTSFSFGSEIWKTSVTNPTGGWVKAASIGNGVSVKNMLFFNSEIIALLDNNSALRSSDGVNWFSDNGIGSGFGNANNFTRDIEIFGGELYALCSNSLTGVQIWKTSNLLSWSPVMQNGFTNGVNLYQAVDLHTAYGKLWVTTVVNSLNPINGAPNNGNNGNNPVTLSGNLGPLVYSSADGSTFTRESDKLFNNLDNNQEWNLYSFSNKTLCYGWNYSRGGGIYSKCIPPVAVATPSGNDSVCVNTGASFSGSSSANADSMHWYRNGNPASTGSFYNMPTFAAMTHTVDLVVWNAGCKDTATLLQTVIDEPLFQGASQFPASACIGQSMEFTVNFSSGGAPPNTYNWIGLTDTLHNDSNTVVLSGPVNYTVFATNAFGCTSPGPYLLGYATPPSYNLGGTVTYGGGPVNGATVYAIKVGASSAQYDTVSTAITNASGIYNFSSLNAGNYLLRVEPDTVTTNFYDNCLNTYYGGTYLWDSATIYQHYCDSNITQANIQLIEVTPVTGPGSISGFVYEGVGFGQKLAQGPGNPVIMTNVIPGVPVKVGKNPGGAIVASGLTGDGTNGTTAGQFVFTNLPYDSYRIYTDIPGYPMDSSYAIVLNASNDSLINLDYFVDSNSVYIDMTTGSHNPATVTEQFNTISIYPNPSNGLISFNIKTETDMNADVKIFDVAGRLVHAENFGVLKSGMNKLSADLSATANAKGIYFVLLRVGEKQFKGKVVVE